MGVVTSVYAPTLVLSTIAKVKAELGITVTTYDSLLTELLRQASATVETYCQRTFARQTYVETTGALGGVYFDLFQAPVVSLSSTTYSGDVLTDVTVADVERGRLYREGGFAWTTARFAGLSAAGGWLADGIPLPLHEAPDYVFTYKAGFLLPSFNLSLVATVSVASSDSSFNDSASGFPSVGLIAGDVIETIGFSNSANNARFVVSGTPTTAKIVVTGTLTTEAAAAGRTVLISNLPYDVEKAVIEVTKSFYAQRSVDSSVTSKSAGPISISRGGAGVMESLGVSPAAVGLLRPWIRRRR